MSAQLRVVVCLQGNPVMSTNNENEKSQSESPQDVEVKLDLTAKRAWFQGRELKLTKAEFRLLACLLNEEFKDPNC